MTTDRDLSADLQARLDAILTSTPADGGLHAGVQGIRSPVPLQPLTIDDMQRAWDALYRQPYPVPEQIVVSPATGRWIQSVGGLENARVLVAEWLHRQARLRRLHARRMHRPGRTRGR